MGSPAFSSEVVVNLHFVLDGTLGTKGDSSMLKFLVFFVILLVKLLLSFSLSQPCLLTLTISFDEN